MNKTRILHPHSNDDLSEKKKRYYRKILKRVKIVQEEKGTLTLSYHEFLQSLNCSHKEYLKAIRLTLAKPQIFQKRLPKDMFISPFSKKILLLMRSNQNIQFVLDPYGAACYIIDYINKSDRGMSNILREALHQIREGNKNLHDCLRQLSTKFHNNSELSIQEACYNILQLHMSESSESCVFIPTFPLENRVRMIKSKDDLKNLPDNSTEIFADGLINHYIDRPHSLDNLTLAEFAASYRFSKKQTSTGIALLRDKGFISKTRKPFVIRYRNYTYETDPDEYLREHLMRFVPWRNEQRDILDIDMELAFTTHQEEIKKIKKLFNALDDKKMSKALHCEK